MPVTPVTSIQPKHYYFAMAVATFFLLLFVADFTYQHLNPKQIIPEINPQEKTPCNNYDSNGVKILYCPENGGKLLTEKEVVINERWRSFEI